MNWGWEDFIFATVLLGGAALGIGLSRRWLKSPASRLIAIGGILLVTALIWVEAAVGIFD